MVLRPVARTDCRTVLILQVVIAALLLSLCPANAASDGNVGHGGGSSVPFEVPPLVADTMPPSSLLFLDDLPLPPQKNAAGRSLMTSVGVRFVSEVQWGSVSG